MFRISKTLLMSIILVAVIASGFIFYKFKLNQPGPAAEPAPSPGLETALAPVNGQTVGEKMPQTNPFEVKVNPFDLYKNPFKK